MSCMCKIGFSFLFFSFLCYHFTLHLLKMTLCATALLGLLVPESKIGFVLPNIAAH
jgi:hypothetical protein